MIGLLKRAVDIYERRVTNEEALLEIRIRECAIREREANACIETEAVNRVTTREWQRAIRAITDDMLELKAGVLVVRAALLTGSADK